MSELFTPPGYVEYPRDRKFRPLDKIDRFELVAKGYLTARLALFGIAPALQVWIVYGGGRPVLAWFVAMGISLPLALGVTFGLNAGLSGMMRSEGKDPAYAAPIAVAVGGFGLILSCGFVSPILSIALFATPALVIYIVLLMSLQSRFIELGIEQPGIWTRKKVDGIVNGLRRGEFPPGRSESEFDAIA